MSKPKPITIDFETEAIEDRPYYPPKPVGVSIKEPGKKPVYLAWGHPTENNTTKEQAERQLLALVTSGKPLLFHNGKFDVDVGQVHMGWPDPMQQHPTDIHDTQFLLFLVDPHSFDLGLKPNANKFLSMPPDEQEELRDWLVSHQKELRSQGLLGDERITETNFGKYIALAPGKLVGKYANGDTLRTAGLFDKLYPAVVEADMLTAYKREQRLMPVLLRNEREGMRADLPALEKDFTLYQKAHDLALAWLAKKLKVDEVPITKPAQMAELLDSRGIVTEWSLTATGKKSMNKKVLRPSSFNDPKVFRALGYLSKLNTCLSTYFTPWLSTARATDGWLHAGWNQTRNDRDAGTRTGRLSGSPNFMAVAKSFEDKGDGWSHPDFIKGLPPLPLMRTYILPDKGCLWGRRDYNQQELRILAHFEDGKLMAAYRDNPRLDVHAFVQASIKELLGIELPRTPVKTLNFGLIYGQGISSTAEKLDRAVEDVRKMRNAQFSALPGLKLLDTTIKQRGRAGQFITTWGGRRYFAEEPRTIQGVYRTFEYKLLNYLIQGSAADCTKEATVRYAEAGYGDARFLVQVHDELNICAPRKAFKAEMLRLREIMMSVEFDVPMMSDAEYGNSWGVVEDLKEPPPDISQWKATR